MSAGKRAGIRHPTVVPLADRIGPLDLGVVNENM
jgi:hypothetical protein